VVNIIKEQKGNSITVRMVGSVEESVEFEQLIGPVTGELVVNCKEIPRINSVGVKGWIKYFQALQQKGVKLKFVECSTAIVEQINLISNFVCGGSVESIYVPFSCMGCKGEFIGLFKTDDLRKLKFQVPELKCSKCGGKAVFDDIPEEYFGFLDR
jgi:anti-anti-sigma regulatory factor